MNCRPGDMAFIVRAMDPRNVGLLVTVRGDGCYLEDGLWAWDTESSHAAPSTYEDGKPAWDTTLAYVPDAHLRPIRPGDISDEEVRDLYAPKVPEAA